MTEIQRLNDFQKIAPEIVTENSAFLDWLTDNGYFHAPASAKYHDAYEGGLYDHSKRVAIRLSLLSADLRLEWQRKESPVLIGLFHDLCKIDQFIEVEDAPGKTMFGEDVARGRITHYEYNKNVLLKGHGDKSVILLSRFLTLTEEEIFCIRYHPGAFEQENIREYRAAVSRFPNLAYVHAVDLLAKREEGETE